MFDHAIDTWWVSTPRKYRVFEREGRRDGLVFDMPLGRFRSGVVRAATGRARSA